MEADVCKSQANFRLDDEPVTDLFFGQSHEYESWRGTFNLVWGIPAWFVQECWFVYPTFYPS